MAMRRFYIILAVLFLAAISFRYAQASLPTPMTRILSPTRGLTLTDVAPFIWFTATLSAIVNYSAIYSDKLAVWTSSIRQSPPVVQKNP